MRRSLAVLIILWVLGAGLIGHALAQTYPLVSGEAITGEPIGPDAHGVVFKKPDGTFTPRVAWTNFTEAALKQLLAAAPKSKPYIEPLLDLEEEAAATKKVQREITIKPPPQLDRLNAKAGMGALFQSPLSAFLLFVLYLANVYAGFEIAAYRRFNPLLVCGVAAVAPVVGPILFLCLPTQVDNQTEAEAAPEAVAETVGAPQAEGAVADAPVEAAPATAPTAPAAPAAPKLPPPIIYSRGQTMFNRRFFETKLAGFLRMVPSEAEKDMVIHIKSARGEYAGTRISRILPNELTLQVTKAGASTDVLIPYTEIQEVQIRHKDA